MGTTYEKKHSFTGVQELEKNQEQRSGKEEELGGLNVDKKDEGQDVQHGQDKGAEHEIVIDEEQKNNAGIIKHGSVEARENNRFHNDVMQGQNKVFDNDQLQKGREDQEPEKQCKNEDRNQVKGISWVKVQYHSERQMQKHNAKMKHQKEIQALFSTNRFSILQNNGERDDINETIEQNSEDKLSMKENKTTPRVKPR